MSTMEVCLMSACGLSLGVNVGLFAYVGYLNSVKRDLVDIMSYCNSCTDKYFRTRQGKMK